MRKNTYGILAEEVKKKLAANNYLDYITYVHHGKWQPYPFHTSLVNIIEQVLAGKLNRVILSAPPRHGKSQACCETLPAYAFGKNPDEKIMVISYSDSLAKQFGRKNKEKVSEFGLPMFGIQLDPASRSVTDFAIKGHSGTFLAAGVTGSITGKGATLLLIDDPIKNDQEARSVVYRERLWELWNGTLKTRLENNARVILIMTRWHEDDLVGRLMKNEPGEWTLFNYECQCTDTDKDPLNRRVGRLLCPELGVDINRIKSLKRDQRVWQALYQGSPAPPDGNLFKRSYMKHWKELPQSNYNIWSLDAAFKGGAKNDFCVLQRWHLVGKDVYLTEQYRGRWDFVRLLEECETRVRNGGYYTAFYIEDAANGPAIVSSLKNKLSGVIAVSPKELGTKEARAQAISPLFESGCVYLPPVDLYDWVDPLSGDDSYVMEMIKFPFGAHDDQVDATTLALIKIQQKMTQSNFLLGRV